MPRLATHARARRRLAFEWVSVVHIPVPPAWIVFVHGRVLFAGDAAHQVSPFGARGANSGCSRTPKTSPGSWHTSSCGARRPEQLLDSYHDCERCAAADENVRHSTRSTDFMAPNSHQEARLRKAVLSLAKETEFGKRMVNGGRLSVPSVYETPLSTADTEVWRGGPRPGASMPDAPVTAQSGESVYLTDAFVRERKRFTLLAFANGADVEAPDGVGVIRIGGEDGLADAVRPGRRALRCRARHRLSAPASRRLCRGALPAADAGRGRRRAGARHRSQLRFWLMALSTSSNFARPDDAFRAVVEAHRGLGDEQSADLDAALVLGPGQPHRRYRGAARGDRAGAAADGGRQPATTAATVTGMHMPRTASRKRLGLGEAACHHKTVVARLDRAIQYAAASRHYRWRLWNTGSPGQAGR